MTPASIYGFLSLIFWLLTLVVSIKYICFVMRADNDGEGGILTLMSLAIRRLDARWVPAAVLIGLVGGSFFYGDGVITPAISVLSAIEGCRLSPRTGQLYRAAVAAGADRVVRDTKARHRQRRQTVRPGDGYLVPDARAAGHRRHSAAPGVLRALNPYWAVNFFLEYKTVSFLRWAWWCCRSPAPKRCTPIWATSVKADPSGVVYAGGAGAGAELLRPGRCC